MATIQVECPTCAAVLELDAVHRNQEVECGSCEAVFLAKPRRTESKRVAKFEDDEQELRFDERDRKPKKKPKKRKLSQREEERRERTHYGDAGLAIGFISLLLFWCPMIGPPIAILGIILSAIGMRSTYPGTAIFGLIMNCLMFVFSLLMLFIFRHAANQAGMMPQP